MFFYLISLVDQLTKTQIGNVIKCSTITGRYIPPEERRGQRLRKIDPLQYPRKKNQVINMQMKNSSIQQLTSEELKKKAAKKIEAFKKFFENEGIDFSLKVIS